MAKSLKASRKSGSLHFNLLGGEHVFGRSQPSSQDWIYLVRFGFRFACATNLAGHLRLNDAQLAYLLGISRATLNARRRCGYLKIEESAKTLRSACILERAIEVFEEQDAAVDWLKCSNSALGDVTPLSLFDTEIGGEEVKRVLGSIEHGLFV